MTDQFNSRETNCPFKCYLRKILNIFSDNHEGHLKKKTKNKKKTWRQRNRHMLLLFIYMQQMCRVFVQQTVCVLEGQTCSTLLMNKIKKKQLTECLYFKCALCLWIPSWLAITESKCQSHCTCISLVASAINQLWWKHIISITKCPPVLKDQVKVPDTILDFGWAHKVLMIALIACAWAKKKMFDSSVCRVMF